MVADAVGSHPRAMTTEQPGAAAGAPARPLRRRAGDRVIGGVAAGIGDYLNVDPLLIRAAFVGLMIFGGAGLVLYVGGWLLIPLEGRNESVAEAALRRIGITPSRLATLALFVIGALIVLYVLVPWGSGGDIGYGPMLYVEPGTVVILVLVILGIVLLRRGGTPRAPAATAVAAPPVPAMAVTPVEEPRPRAPRSPLGWYVVAATLVLIGLLAMVAQATDVSVLPGQFFGVALAVVGIGLLVGSWWGHARILILPALFVLPFAVAATFITAPLEGGTGDQAFAPVTESELRDEYRLLAGRMTLDLTDLDVTGEPVEITASVAMGELIVILPPEARVEIRSKVGAGSSWVFDSFQSGTSLQDRYARGTTGPQFVLDLEAGIGRVLVDTLRGN